MAYTKHKPAVQECPTCQRRMKFQAQLCENRLLYEQKKLNKDLYKVQKGQLETGIYNTCRHETEEERIARIEKNIKKICKDDNNNKVKRMTKSYIGDSKISTFVCESCGAAFKLNNE